MFKGTKMFLAAATVAAMMPAVSNAAVNRPSRAELQKQLVAAKAAKGEAAMKKGAMLNANLLRAAKYNKTLQAKQQTPFAMAAKQVAGVARPQAARMLSADAAASMYGYIAYDGASGLYSGQEVQITLPGGVLEAVGEPSAMGTGMAWADNKLKGIYVDDTYAMFGFYWFSIISIDPENNWVIESATDVDDGGYGWYAISMTSAPDGVGGIMCSYNTDASGFELSYVDFEACTKSVIAPTNNLYTALALGKDGMVYGLADDNALWSINPNTGAETRIGDTGLVYSDYEGSYGQSAAIDPRTGIMYWAELDASGAGAGLYTVDLTTGAATLAADYGLMQVFGLAIPSAQAEDGAPSAATDLVAAFEGNSLTGTVSFVAPTTTYAGDVLVGDLTYTLEANGVQVASAAAAPGEQVSVEVTVEQGVNNFIVTMANAVGTSPKAKTSCFVGNDYPMAPANVTLAIDEEGAVSLTWDAPAAGIHNGYLGELTYNVYDQNFDMVAEGLTECVYTTAIEIGQMQQYVFSVEAVNAGLISAMASSNGVVVGNALECPVEMAMNEATFSTLTVVDNNGDGRTWSLSGEEARYTYSANNKGDDYLITPGIKLKAGRQYILNVNTFSYSTSYPETIEFTVGQGTTAAAQSTVIGEARVLPTAEDNVETVEFTVAEDGEYNIGFHAVSDADMFYLKLKSFSLVAGALPEAPAAVADLTATAGAEGALEATVAFTAPTVRINGEALESLTQICVLRDDQTVKVFEAPQPGEALSFVDTDLTTGTHTWTVIPANEAEEGISATVSAFVGQDVPAAPMAELTDLNTQVRIDWAPVTVGENGGYINTAEVVYEIYSITDDGYIGELIASTSECTATVDYNTNTGDATLLQFAMRTVTSVAASVYYGTDAIPVGTPAALPWVEEFEGGSLANFMWLLQSENPLSQIGLSTDMGGVAAFAANDAEQSGSLFSGKISLAGAQNPMVLLSYDAFQSYSFDVVAMTAAGETAIAHVDNDGDAESHALAVAIPAEIAAEPWMVVGVTATSHEAGTLYLENIMVRDVLEYNLALELSAPAKVEKGSDVKVVVTVTNEGSNAVEGVKVNLTAGEEVIELTSDVTLASYESVALSADIATSIFDEAETLELEAEVVYDLDLKPEDNVASASVVLLNSTAQGVENLAAEVSADGVVTLSWTVSENAYAETTESWEEYDNLSAFPYTAAEADGSFASLPETEGQLGEWTAYDLDGQGIYGWNSTAINWPYMGDAMGFCVYDAAEVFGASMENPLEAVHSGAKGLLCMDIAPANGVSHNDDWLISPELPGIAQTVSFWVNEITSQYGPETFEFYYSETDMDVESFILLGQGIANADNGWMQYSYDLPEGAKYFAIRVTSADIFGMYIDDITFTAGSPAAELFEVYCDGELIATTSECTYTAAQGTDHTYSVVAVYGNGKKSAPVSIYVENPVAIEQINAAAENVKAYNINGVRVNAAEAKNGIFVIEGKKVAK